MVFSTIKVKSRTKVFLFYSNENYVSLMKQMRRHLAIEFQIPMMIMLPDKEIKLSDLSVVLSLDRFDNDKEFSF